MHNMTHVEIAIKHSLTPTEREAVLTLLTNCDTTEQLHTAQLLRLLRMQSDSEANDFLIYADGMLIGYAALSNYGTDERDILAIIDPQYRRQGIFRRLLHTITTTCQQRRIERIVIPCEHHTEAARLCMEALAIPFLYAEHAMTLGTLQSRPMPATPVLFRAAQTDEGPLITALMMDGTMSAETIQELVTNALQKPNERFYFGIVHNEIIGILRLIQMQERVGIYSFVVREDCRGKGYGRQMLQQAIYIAQEQKPQEITLEVDVTNTNAIGLYRSCGFTITTTYDYYLYNIPQR